MNRDDIDLESRLGIDPDQLHEDVRTQLGEFVATHDQRLMTLRERAINAEQEAHALQTRLEALQEQVASLEDSEFAGMNLDPAMLVSSFGDALASEQLQESAFTVSDISVDLRANVVSTEDGVRVNLPQPGGHAPTQSLSELQFAVRADPATTEPELMEVPDAIGLTEESAAQAITDAGFAVGRVETVPSDERAGRVVAQLPSPFSLAESGAPVDLEVAEDQPMEMTDLIGQHVSDAVRFVGDRLTPRDITSVESEEPPGTVIEQEPAPGADIEELNQLSLTIAEAHSPKQPRTETGPDEEENTSLERPLDAAGEETRKPTVGDEVGGEETSGTVEEGTPGRARLRERLQEAVEMEATDEAETVFVERDITEIDGIGDTYGQRLRDAGIESLADLGVAEPVEVADAANVSRERAMEWIEAVHVHLRSLTESDRGFNRGTGEE